ncbi:MAG: helix-turn-helix domain-containing protein [Myxococcales bacterium]|nr:helix-turn-helix domain-containing protein [Myxococcales bacterium]
MGSLQSDESALAEVGQRLARRRIELGMTQAELAEHAGVGKRTLERLEHGDSTQLTNYVRILRSLELLEAWIEVHPQPGPSPMALLREQKREKKRVRKSARGEQDEPWTWGDES